MFDPHGEEARRAVSNHEARISPGPSFETREERAPQDEDGGCGRHCEERSDEAIHRAASGWLDCFASLAMTETPYDIASISRMVLASSRCAPKPPATFVADNGETSISASV